MRKTMRMSEIRALANRYLAAPDPELIEFRRGVAAMYEHLAIAAGDYHGYNDIIQVWEGEPGESAYIPDELHRRVYFGQMSGPDAEPAERAIKAYRATADAETARRRRLVAAPAEDELPPEPECGACGIRRDQHGGQGHAWQWLIPNPG